MNTYQPPLADIRFLLEAFDYTGVVHAMPKYADFDLETNMALLEEYAKFCVEVLLPLNETGDKQGVKYVPETHDVVTPDGFKEAYAAYRDADDDSYYYRIMNYHLPFFTQSPAANLQKACLYVFSVPIDNTHTMQWWLSNDPERAGRPENEMALLPNTTDWLGRFRPAVLMENDMDIDREAQKYDTTWKGYTGIATIPDQDRGIAESQGGIQDRSREHLAGSDAMIIQVRGLLMQTANALHDQGALPPGVDEPRLYRQRSGSITLPRAVDVWEATKDLREAFDREA